MCTKFEAAVADIADAEIAITHLLVPVDSKCCRPREAGPETIGNGHSERCHGSPIHRRRGQDVEEVTPGYDRIYHAPQEFA